MKTIIAGSRDGVTPQHIAQAMLACGWIPSTVVSGTARGADMLGEQWAAAKGIPVERFPADWATHGKAAGYRRNEEMALNADALVAIWDGSSKGTGHMINLARKHGLTVFVHYTNQPNKQMAHTPPPQQDGTLNAAGRIDAPILVITDAPSPHTYDTGGVMSGPQMKLLQTLAESAGIPGREFQFLTPCAPIPEDADKNERKITAWLDQHRQEFNDRLAEIGTPSVILTLGKVALRQLMGKAVKVTEARGSFTTCPLVPGVPVLPLLSPANVLRRPEVKPTFDGDFMQLVALRDSSWDVGIFAKATTGANYRWCLDLSDLLNDPPPCLTFDLETKGLDWRNGRKAILVASLTFEEGHALVVPLDKDYFNDPSLRGTSSQHLPLLTDHHIAVLIGQLKFLLGNPDVKVVGHNLKFDAHHCRNYGIEVANWFADTMQLIFAVDENMERKSLDEGVRRWVPEMAGYADAFNVDPVHVSKSRMDLVPHDKMIRYAGGDTDSDFRLATRLIALCKQDSRQWQVLRELQMPALKAFIDVEEQGMMLDTAALAELHTLYGKKEADEYKWLIEAAAKKAPAVLRRHEEAGLAFSRPEFVADLLFSEDGFGLTPRVWTDSTKKLPLEQRVPSTSINTHLPFFEHVPFVKRLMAYQKIQKMRSTYIGRQAQTTYAPIKRTKAGKLPPKVLETLADAGIVVPLNVSIPARRRTIPQPIGTLTRIGKYAIDERKQIWLASDEEASGFWQYLTENNTIHPSFDLSTAVTGRSACRNPNLQNIPIRGVDAAPFRRIFIAGYGYVLIELDLSQAELRIAACMANELNMLRIYRDGGDIHTSTVAGVLGIPYDQVTDVQRQGGKAINFGFLYGMWWKKFMDYAKTTYGVTFTAKQAEAIRERFFALYPGLPAWHEEMKKFVRANGFVRALHGAVRHLPSINSDNDMIRQETERQSINSPVQRLASDINLLSLARFNRDAPRTMRVIGSIHDSLILRVKESDALEAIGAAKYYMENNPLEELFGCRLSIPIIADAKMGSNLMETQKLKDLKAVRPIWYDER